ncbi:hypothetical protein Tco_1471049 [Tanacetum coccineum]
MNQFLSILCLLIVLKPVRAMILQWHQSQRFKTWEKPIKSQRLQDCKSVIQFWSRRSKDLRREKTPRNTYWERKKSRWKNVVSKKGKRVLTDKDQEAVKECYKEYIGMVKIYYEEEKRSRHGEPGDVAVNCRGTARKERPQADARIDAEVEEMLDGTPRKKSRTARDDVKMEGNKNKRRNSRNFCGRTTQREEKRLIMLLVNNDSILVNLVLVDCAKTSRPITTTFDVFPGDILTLSPATCRSCRWGISDGEASSGILSPATIPSD